MERHPDIYTDEGTIDLYPLYQQACRKVYSDDEPERDPFLQMLIDYENENEERYGFKSYNDMRAWANGYDWYEFNRHRDDEWMDVEYEYDPYSFEAQMYGGYDF